MISDQQHKPALLVISDVLPFPQDSGQNMRVYYMLLAASKIYRITFLTINERVNHKDVSEPVRQLCEEVILISAIYKTNPVKRLLIKIAGETYFLFTGLKFSNFLNGRVEFTGKRIAKAIGSRDFDIVLYEYWHSWRSTYIFRDKNIPCILDTHNVLWQSYAQQYNRKLPVFVKKFHFNAYKAAEENSWNYFDGIIAINRNEYGYVKTHTASEKKVFLMEMGIDISKWNYAWHLKGTPSLTYYGSFQSSHNMASALVCAQQIMPLIWNKYPEAEFWIIGSTPGKELLALQKDSRIHVTGFVENVQNVLKNANIFLCPWQGTYGFRSRLIETMAIGLPVITTTDAVDGIDLREGKGLYLAENPAEFAEKALYLLDHTDVLIEQSKAARAEVEMKYSFENTYLRGIFELNEAYPKR